MSPDDRDRLRHMLDAAREAIQFLDGFDAAALEGDRMRALAVIKSIETVGEAASKVLPPMRARHPDIPWVDAEAMRHRLVHGYYAIDAQRVVDTVRENLPPLVALLERAIAAEA